MLHREKRSIRAISSGADHLSIFDLYNADINRQLPELIGKRVSNQY